jgi:hypothetical protein
MAMLFFIQYPNGERVMGTGYPNTILRVGEVPCGPECCYQDQVEVDFTDFSKDRHDAGLPVLRVVGGPRRPTIHVRVEGTEAERELWMDDREAEGWSTNSPPAGGSIVWVVASRDGMDVEDLERTGGTIIG